MCKIIGNFQVFKKVRWLFLLLMSLTLITACGGGGDDFVGQPVLTGVFTDGPVAGLRYTTATLSGTTNDQGQFRYRQGETVTFFMGDLELGSAEGAEVLTPRDIVDGAADVGDRQVNNMLVFLQILDQDGDLNNGIQLTSAIRDIVSTHAGDIDFDQSVYAFPASLLNLLAALNNAAVFTDTHRGPRAFLPYADPGKIAQNAREHFVRSQSARITVNTTTGRVVGSEPILASSSTPGNVPTVNNAYWQWLGIPYGQNTAGANRWKPPLPMANWETRDAIAWGDQAPQAMSYVIYGEGNASENCLNLNITVKKTAMATGNLPVMVWFHGGAFSILTSNAMSYNNPASLPSKDVVLVTVNHRLGPLGYLAHPLLTAESSYGGSGNYGQMDLILALEWIKANIASFGDDPENITIFGQSGGGGKSISLMASPEVPSGLFHKVICQSGMTPLWGAGLMSGYPLAYAEGIGSDLTARMAGLGFDVSTADAMRAIPWSTMINSDLATYGASAWLRYALTIDNHYMPDTMADLIENLAHDVPLMAGATTADMASLDEGFVQQMIHRAVHNTGPLYAYVWDYVPPGWREFGAGAYHGIELVYTFAYPASFITHFLMGLVTDTEGTPLTWADVGASGPTDLPGILVSSGYFDIAQLPALVPKDESLIVTNDVMEAWANFAKFGDPSFHHLPNGCHLNWTAYTGEPPTGNGTYAIIRADDDSPFGYWFEKKEDGLVSALNL